MCTAGLQIKKLAKCQQLFSHGFATDASTLEVLLELEKTKSAHARKRLSSASLSRTSVFEVATSIFGQDGMEQRAPMRQRGSRCGASRNWEWLRSSTCSATAPARDCTEHRRSGAPAPPGDSRERRRSSASPGARRAGASGRAVQALNRMATRSFVNPALLAPVDALLAAGALHRGRESVVGAERRSSLLSPIETTRSGVLARQVLKHSYSPSRRSVAGVQLADANWGASTAAAAPPQEVDQLLGLVADCCGMVQDMAAEVNAIKSAVLYSQFQIATQAAGLERQRDLDARRGQS